MHRPSAPKMHVHGVAGGFKGRALRSPRAITARPKSQSGINVVGRFQKNVMNKFLNISKNRARVVNRSIDCDKVHRVVIHCVYKKHLPYVHVH